MITLEILTLMYSGLLHLSIQLVILNLVSRFVNNLSLWYYCVETSATMIILTTLMRVFNLIYVWVKENLEVFSFFSFFLQLV